MQRPYKMLFGAYLIGMLLFIIGCATDASRETAKDRQIHELELKISDQNEVIQRLETDLKYEKNKPVVIKYVDKIVEKEQDSMTFFKIMGMWIMGLSAGASVILHFLIPSMWYFGVAGLATGGWFYYSALTNQFLTPFMPYIMMGVVGLIFFGAVIFAYYHVDWSNKEKKGLSDIVYGDSTTDEAKKLIENVLVKEKPKFLSVFHNLIKK